MSMPVTAGSPFGGPAFQSSRPMPWWPIAGPIDVKANVGGSFDNRSVTALLMAACPSETPSAL